MIIDLVSLVVDSVLESRGELNISDTKARQSKSISSQNSNKQKNISICEKQKDRLFSQDAQINRLMDVKKKIFIRQSGSFYVGNYATTQSSSVDEKVQSSQETNDKKSVFASLMDEEKDEEDENDFYLQPPDKFNISQKHLYQQTTFFIGGKVPVSIGPVELSKNFKVKEVIKFVLTLYRKNKAVNTAVKLEYATQPECFELRIVDDDSDDDSDN